MKDPDEFRRMEKRIEDYHNGLILDQRDNQKAITGIIPKTIDKWFQ